jgi:hypothetical protein
MSEVAATSLQNDIVNAFVNCITLKWSSKWMPMKKMAIRKKRKK